MSNHQNKTVCLEVQHLVKSYGGRRVVNGLSFKVHCGEIVGQCPEHRQHLPRRYPLQLVPECQAWWVVERRLNELELMIDMRCRSDPCVYSLYLFDRSRNDLSGQVLQEVDGSCRCEELRWFIS